MKIVRPHRQPARYRARAAFQHAGMAVEQNRIDPGIGQKGGQERQSDRIVGCGDNTHARIVIRMAGGCNRRETGWRRLDRDAAGLPLPRATPVWPLDPFGYPPI